MRSCLPGDTHARFHPKVRTIHSKGAVIKQIDPVLTDMEANYLRAKARGKFQASETEGLTNNVRTSWTAYPPSDNVLKCLERRFSKIAGMPAAALEELQVSEYSHGEFYKPHLDCLEREDEPQRVKTLLTYLNDRGLQHGRCGGATSFPRLRTEDGEPLRIYPKKGRALLWENLTEHGSPNRFTLHAGEPLTCNRRKSVLNAWILNTPRKKASSRARKSAQKQRGAQKARHRPLL